jgi:uncharacterized protein
VYLPAPDETFLIGALRVALRIPGARSLKDRRRSVLSIRDRIHANHGAAVAEVGWLEEPGHAVLGFTLVSNDAALLRSRLDAIVAQIERAGDVLLVDRQVEIWPFGDRAGRHS